MILYDFIKENKLEMYIRYSQKTHRLEGGLFIPYYLLEDFIEIAQDFLTDNWSDDECKALLQENYILFQGILDLIDYQEWENNERPLKEYRDLFYENEFGVNEYDYAMAQYEKENEQ